MDGELFVCQIYVHNIIIGSTNHTFSEEFEKMMADKFEMSMIGELKFFLGLQIRQQKIESSFPKRSMRRTRSRSSTW